MSIDAINDGLDYELNGVETAAEGTDGQRKYLLLERGDYCSQCFNHPRMKELGIENISFQVYQLAEQKLFTMDFKVRTKEDEPLWLHFANRVTSANEHSQFFAEVEEAASSAGAVGLASLAHDGAVITAGSRPPHLNSAYLRCMDACDKIEFELFKLLCYAICTWKADKTPGS